MCLVGWMIMLCLLRLLWFFDHLLQIGIPCGFLLADLTVVVVEFGFERIFPSETDFN